VALVVVVLVAAPVLAADMISVGTIKSVDANKKQFVLTETAGKDYTFTLGDNAVINRDGKEGKAELKPGDPVSIFYDKGVTTWTAQYILVREGENKDLDLGRGTVKGVDADKHTLMLTDLNNKDWNFEFAKDLKVMVNGQASKPADL